MSRPSAFLRQALTFLTWCFAHLRQTWVRLITGMFVVILTAWFTYTGYNKWEETINNTNVCSFGPSYIKEHFRYIQLILNSQNLRDPVFDGRYFLNLGNEFGNGSYDLHILQAGKRHYGATTLHPALNWDEGFKRHHNAR